MLQILGSGARTATQRWALVLALWPVSSLFGAAFALASGYWLALALDGSLATRTLVHDLDPNILIDLYYYHGESFRMLLILGAVLAVGYVFLWVWLNGVVIAAVRADPTSAWTECWRLGLRASPRLARLLGFAWLALILFTGAVVASVWWSLRWQADTSSALLPYGLGAAGAVLWGFGTALLVAVHDQARIRAYAERQGAWASYCWSWSFVTRGGEGAFPLALALQATALALWAGYQAIGLSVRVEALFGVTGTLILGQLFLLVRTWIRVWFYAAQSELQP
jgi:hypothetical protein